MTSLFSYSRLRPAPQCAPHCESSAPSSCRRASNSEPQTPISESHRPAELRIRIPNIAGPARTLPTKLPVPHTECFPHHSRKSRLALSYLILSYPILPRHTFCRPGIDDRQTIRFFAPRAVHAPTASTADAVRTATDFAAPHPPPSRQPARRSRFRLRVAHIPRKPIRSPIPPADAPNFRRAPSSQNPEIRPIPDPACVQSGVNGTRTHCRELLRREAHRRFRSIQAIFSQSRIPAAAGSAQERPGPARLRADAGSEQIQLFGIDHLIGIAHGAFDLELDAPLLLRTVRKHRS